VDPEPKPVAGKPERCPACGRRDIRPSVARGPWDAVMRFFSLSPYRCRACSHRFYRRMRWEETAESKPESPDPGASEAPK